MKAKHSLFGPLSRMRIGPAEPLRSIVLFNLLAGRKGQKGEVLFVLKIAVGLFANWIVHMEIGWYSNPYHSMDQWDQWLEELYSRN